ncbi:hypothetical protein ACO0LO_16110 [Undibacterium sp. TJN25]|uniref:hypothetical protein n=1 Tax=Undibacterium sp. TJN25 TaxID=3413056 RepID=UPI003BF44537
MKKLVLAAALVAASGSIFAADVGVSINFAQPGVYGRVDIGAVPAPQVVYTRPQVIYAPQPGVVVEPLYLYVPIAHQRNWRRYCGGYHACGQPVYFVQENWYRNVYAPRYREYVRGPGRGPGPVRYEERRDYRGDHRGPGWDHGRDHEHEHEHDRDHDRGHDDHHGRDH